MNTASLFLLLTLGTGCFQASNYLAISAQSGSIKTLLLATPLVILGTYLFMLYFNRGIQHMPYLTLMGISISVNIVASILVDRFFSPNSTSFGLQTTAGLGLLVIGISLLLRSKAQIS